MNSGTFEKALCSQPWLAQLKLQQSSQDSFSQPKIYTYGNITFSCWCPCIVTACSPCISEKAVSFFPLRLVQKSLLFKDIYYFISHIFLNTVESNDSCGFPWLLDKNLMHDSHAKNNTISTVTISFFSE